MKEITHSEQQNITGVTPATVIPRTAFTSSTTDLLATEIPIALVYNGISHAVMMATPQDLAAFAVGFSLSEGIIEKPQEIYGIDIEPDCRGISVNIELSSRRFAALKERRRSLTGRTGCGICGTEQLADIYRPLTPLPFTHQFDLSTLDHALSHLRTVQHIGQLTGCTHAAVSLDGQGNLLGGCEDIGRHVALDKLLGMQVQQRWATQAVLVSSRASYEMVQKAVMCGVEILFAVSAATSLAQELAERYNLTLVVFCRQQQGNILCHPQRLAIK